MATTVAIVWPGGQAAKTPPFHGGNTSSILVRVTNKKSTTLRVVLFLFLNHIESELREFAKQTRYSVR